MWTTNVHSIKQYHKEGQAVTYRDHHHTTPATSAWDGCCANLPELRRIGFAANRRMLEIEQISHDCALGEDAFQDLQRPRHVDGQRAPALRFADPNVQALLHALVMFVFVARGLYQSGPCGKPTPCCWACVLAKSARGA